MDIILSIAFFSVIVAFFIAFNINFYKILKFDEFKSNRFLGGLGWMLAIYKKRDNIDLLDPKLQSILLKGRKLAKAMYLTVTIMIFLSIVMSIVLKR